MRLTPNQKETLHAIVKGQCSGMLLKPIPSLVKKGLLTQRPPPVGTMVVPRPPTSVFSSFPVQFPWLLTQLGLEAYKELRKSSHETSITLLEDSLRRDLSWAESKTVRGGG